MTREEHIENLKAIASDMPSDKCADWIESLMAGVKALEQEPCEDCCNGNQIEKAKLCQKSYLAGMGHKQEPCGDAVSREAVLDINEHYHGQMPSHVNHEIWKEINALLSVAPMQKWIPVSEGLPEDNTLVLVTVKVGNREPKVRSGYYYMNGHFHIDNGDCWEARDKELIAWMPLPTPPNKSEIPTGQIAANGELYPGEFDDPLAEEGSDKE